MQINWISLFCYYSRYIYHISGFYNVSLCNFLVTLSWKLLKSWKIEILSNFSWFTKVISAYYVFLGVLFLCMPNLWSKGFTHRKYQVFMINGSEIMTSSILNNLCRPPKYWTYSSFYPFSSFFSKDSIGIGKNQFCISVYLFTFWFLHKR